MADEHDAPGQPPRIRDEAADSPMWLPALGLSLLIVCALLVLWRSIDTEDAAAEEPTAEVAVEAAEAPEEAEPE